MKTVELTIDDLSSKGEGVSHIEGYTLFVEGALPGEKVQARMLLEKKKLWACSAFKNPPTVSR